MFRYLWITLILALIAGGIVVPFAIGLVKGPTSRRSPLDSPGARLLSPLSRVATLYGRFLILYVVVTLFGDSYDRTARYPVVCASAPYDIAGGGGGGVTVKTGTTLESQSTVQVCTGHPTASQWLLYGLIRLPSLVVWALVLLLVWQLIREAARSGPFTQQSAYIMFRLGLVILAGTAVAAALSALGTDLLVNMLLVSPNVSGVVNVTIDVLIYEPLKALLPWPALAGAALLSFSRITVVGAKLDEEVKATV